jgi:hypothetical protein
MIVAKTSDILNIDFKNKDVVICGIPKAGKTTIAQKIHYKNPSHTIIHTDDFIKYDYNDALYEIRKCVAGISGNYILEGVLAARFLRKGAENGDFLPNIVINCCISDENLEKEYSDKKEKFLAVKGMAKGLKSIFNNYMNISKNRQPEIYEFWNEKYTGE